MEGSHALLAYHARLQLLPLNSALPAHFARLVQTEHFVPRTPLPLNRRYHPRLIVLLHHCAEILHDEIQSDWRVLPKVFEAIVAAVLVKVTAVAERSVYEVLQDKNEADV